MSAPDAVSNVQVPGSRMWTREFAPRTMEDHAAEPRVFAFLCPWLRAWRVAGNASGAVLKGGVVGDDGCIFSGEHVESAAAPDCVRGEAGEGEHMNRLGVDDQSAQGSTEVGSPKVPPKASLQVDRPESEASERGGGCEDLRATGSGAGEGREAGASSTVDCACAGGESAAVVGEQSQTMPFGSTFMQLLERGQGEQSGDEGDCGDREGSGGEGAAVMVGSSVASDAGVSRVDCEGTMASASTNHNGRGVSVSEKGKPRRGTGRPRGRPRGSVGIGRSSRGMGRGTIGTIVRGRRRGRPRLSGSRGGLGVVSGSFRGSGEYLWAKVHVARLAPPGHGSLAKWVQRVNAEAKKKGVKKGGRGTEHDGGDCGEKSANQHASATAAGTRGQLEQKKKEQPIGKIFAKTGLDMDGRPMKRALLLTGNHGCGKETAVMLACKRLGFKIVCIEDEHVRSKEQSWLNTAFVCCAGNTCVFVPNVDDLSGGARAHVVRQVLNREDRVLPVICTALSANVGHMENVVEACNRLNVECSMKRAVSHISRNIVNILGGGQRGSPSKPTLAAVEELVSQVVDVTQGDLRHAILQLQLGLSGCFLNPNSAQPAHAAAHNLIQMGPTNSDARPCADRASQSTEESAFFEAVRICEDCACDASAWVLRGYRSEPIPLDRWIVSFGVDTKLVGLIVAYVHENYAVVMEKGGLRAARLAAGKKKTKRGATKGTEDPGAKKPVSDLDGAVSPCRHGAEPQQMSSVEARSRTPDGLELLARVADLVSEGDCAELAMSQELVLTDFVRSKRTRLSKRRKSSSKMSYAITRDAETVALIRESPWWGVTSFLSVCQALKMLALYPRMPPKWKPKPPKRARKKPASWYGDRRYDQFNGMNDPQLKNGVPLLPEEYDLLYGEPP